MSVTGENCNRISLGVIKCFWHTNSFTCSGLSGYEQLVLDFSHGKKRPKNTGLIFSAGQEIPPHFMELEVSLS